MGHEELKEIGINAYGHRHKLIKGVERLLGGQQGKLLGGKLSSVLSKEISGWFLGLGSLAPEHMQVTGTAFPAFLSSSQTSLRLSLSLHFYACLCTSSLPLLLPNSSHQSLPLLGLSHCTAPS